MEKVSKKISVLEDFLVNVLKVLYVMLPVKKMLTDRVRGGGEGHFCD